MLGCDAEPGSRKLTVPSIDASAAGSADAYVPRTGWPAWAVLPAGVVIALLSMAVSIAGSIGRRIPRQLDWNRPRGGADVAVLSVAVGCWRGRSR